MNTRIMSLALLAATASAQAAEPADPFRWLEDVSSQQSLNWVQAHNAVSTRLIEQTPGFDTLQNQLREVLDSQSRIPYVTRMGAYYYNFWRDADHPRGLWRRTTPSEYRNAEPKWEVVIDLDELSHRENANWVWKGALCRPLAWDRCLIQLSRGGADAVEVREFDLAEQHFVKDGFTLPEAKSHVAWQSRDAIFVGTDFGPGSLTDSGYPRIVKLWQRGTALTTASTVLEGETRDMSVSAYVVEDHGFRREIVQRQKSFYAAETYVRNANRLERLAIADDTTVHFYGAQMLLVPRSDWQPEAGQHYRAGSLLAIDFAAFQAGARNFQVLFEPTAETAFNDLVLAKNQVILKTLDKVKGRLFALRLDAGKWTRQEVDAPAFGSLSLMAEGAPDESDDYFLSVADFLTPDTLYLMHPDGTPREALKSRPAFFNAEGLEVAQYEATSKDGTRVPYFIVKPRDLKLDGSHATLLYGYGGFEISLTPNYSAGVGKGWLEKGGVYVLANIRGGGEFGPRWHEAALKDKRQHAYDDFIAVAQDLIARKITQPKKLGIMGGSNGGLLMGVMLTQRPDLFGAVVCQVPLLDMRRYNKLLAGASWMGEYGDPDKAEEWAYIKRYSPYHHVRRGVHYPNVLFATSTRDDRVHPGHARKMMAKMEAAGVKNVWYYENTEGGHAGAANNQQQAHMAALAYTFLWRMLGNDAK